MKAAEEWLVELEHHVLAPPAEVFEYFVDPEKFGRWLGVEVELDPRPGGIFKISAIPGVWTRGTYEVVDRPRRVVITWGFESNGPTLPKGLLEVPVASSTVDFTFIPDVDGTIVRVRHQGLPSEVARWAHEQGWLTYLPRLGRVVVGDDPGDEPAIELAQALLSHDQPIEGND